MLKEKYDDLCTEVQSKLEMMKKQMTDKEGMSDNIESEMAGKIREQEENLKSQITLYDTQLEGRQKEEEEMKKVYTEYKSKYEEFDRAMKKSRDTFKKYE